MYQSIKSIMADRSSDKTSDRYSFVPTYKVINLLESNGWFVSNARESRSKVNAGFQKHVVRFRQVGDQNRMLELNEIVPEIVMKNAHDGSAYYELMSGFERCWCTNQCTVSESTIMSHKIKHIGYTDGAVLNAVNSIMEQTPKVIDNIKRFKSVQLNEDERWMMAEMALDILFDNSKWNRYNKEHTIDKVLKPVREQDKETNLWNVFNIIQEKFIKGGKWLVTEHEGRIADAYGWEGNWVKGQKVRKIKSIDRDIEINRSLWSLTEQIESIKELV
jgi:hypothetical protein